MPFLHGLAWCASDPLLQHPLAMALPDTSVSALATVAMTSALALEIQVEESLEAGTGVGKESSGRGR